MRNPAAPGEAYRRAHVPVAVGPGRRESTVLVVGAAGYCGSIVVSNLLDAGYDVIAFDALLYGAHGIAPVADRPGFELVVGDTRDSAELWPLLTRAGSVIHLGEIVGDPACDLDPSVTEAINLRATARLVSLAVNAGVSRFVYPSSCSVYGATDHVVDEGDDPNPLSLYARLKRDSEQSVLAHASATFHPTIFRIATAYGLSPRPRFDLVVNILAARAAAEGSIVVQGGGQWRPFVHIADVAGLLAGTLERPAAAVSGQVFNLGSNTQNYTIAEVADIVQQELPAVRVLVSDSVDRRNYRVSFDRVGDVLGFTPTRTVAEGVAEIVRAVGNGHIADVRYPGYSNVRALVETSARLRLWRPELGDGDPAAPFRPKDVLEALDADAGDEAGASADERGGEGLTEAIGS